MPRRKKLKIVMILVGVTIILASFLSPLISVIQEKAFSGFIPSETQEEILLIGPLEKRDEVQYYGCFTRPVICGLTTLSLLICYERMPNNISSWNGDKTLRHLLLECRCGTIVASVFTVGFPEVYIFLIGKLEKNISAFYWVLFHLFIMPYDELFMPLFSLGVTVTIPLFWSFLSHRSNRYPSLKERKGKPDYVA